MTTWDTQKKKNLNFFCKAKLGSRLIPTFFREVENWVTIQFYILLGRGKFGGCSIPLRAWAKKKTLNFFCRRELGGHLIILNSPKKKNEINLFVNHIPFPKKTWQSSGHPIFLSSWLKKEKNLNFFCERKLDNYPIFMCILEEENLAIAWFFLMLKPRKKTWKFLL